MMMVEDIRKDFNNSLKEIQENTAKEVQVLKKTKQTKKKQNRKTQPNRCRHKNAYIYTQRQKHKTKQNKTKQNKTKTGIE